MEPRKIMEINRIINLFNSDENKGQKFLTHADACLKISKILNQ